MADRYLLEDGSGVILLEDGSGALLLEVGAIGFRSLLAMRQVPWWRLP